MISTYKGSGKMMGRTSVKWIAMALIGVMTAVSVNTYQIVKADSALPAINSPENDSDSYASYIDRHSDSIDRKTFPIDINLMDYSAIEGDVTKLTHLGDREGSFIETFETGSIEWSFDVENEGLYNIQVQYFNKQGKGSSIVRAIYLDGEIPFREAGSITLMRAFMDASKKTVDLSGNEIRQSQTEQHLWQQVVLADTLGYYDEPYQFYLSAGKHTLRFESIRENLVLGAISFVAIPQLNDYQQMHSFDILQGYSHTKNQYIEIQGESATTKSNNMMYAISDYSSPATKPSSPDKIVLNTIGGHRWQSSGQWLEWRFVVEESGFYKIGIRSRKNLVPGQPAYRSFYIDDEIPCNELQNVKFNYNSKWQMKEIGEQDEPYYFFLDKGEHSLKMSVRMGELANLVQRVNTVMDRLTEIYMKLLIVIGPTPDLDRDYLFEKTFPDELKVIESQGEELRDIGNEFIQIVGMNSSQSQQLLNLADQLEKMHTKPDKIARMFTNNDFVNNISALGTWINTAMQQPLEIDYIAFASADVVFPKPEATFFETSIFAIRQFISSFFTDYSTIGLVDKESASISVWISSGRDQANTLSQMTINEFTSKTGIRVNLQLVPPGTLLNATIANKGPDVALSNAQSEPLNYAIRGAIHDLSVFDGFSEVSQRFMESALEPFTFDGRVYAIPETQNFPVLFYRSDILQEIGLEVPQTWDDVIEMLPILQKKNLSFGLPQPYIVNLIGAGMGVYSMFLYQNNGSYYFDGGRISGLDSKEAVDAFYQWIKFYNAYSLPFQYDFVSRFRTGEVPIGISDYNIYNVLSVFAPELNGVWKLDLVPGTRQSDGTVDRSVASTVTGTIMMKSTKNTEDAWEFIKWWTRSDTQEQYGNEIESIMGSAGRYQTANVEALYKIPWNARDYKLLIDQLSFTKGIPEVPGSYMTSRYLDSAFKQAFVSTASWEDRQLEPGEILENAAKLINSEIRSKRDEFGLDDESGSEGGKK
jgi:ABC-type glycerol-3-phosphate transport system substrate-binding protein